MGYNKNQHYIPKLYLRHFSFERNGHEIGLYNLENQFFTRRAPLRKQAKVSFFYGKDGAIDNWLQEVESKAAPIITSILTRQAIPLGLSPEYMYLFTFSMLFSVRTKLSTQNMQHTLEKVVNEIARMGEPGEDLQAALKFRFTEPGAYMVGNSNKSFPYATDLKMKVLLNRTQTDFITSDSPMISCNQFLEKRKHPGGWHGLFNKGLQLILPISPRAALIYFDEWAYRVGDKKQQFVPVPLKADIDKLNFLQMACCGQQVFFNETISQEYLRSVMPMVNKYWVTNKSDIKQMRVIKEPNGVERTVLRVDSNHVSANLDFSFISQTKRAKSHQLNDYQVQLRNENLRYSDIRRNRG